jgi:pentatricopeptide repeat protein
MLRGYARLGKLECCGDLLDQMSRTGVLPDRRSFMAIFEGLARLGAVQRFQLLWNHLCSSPDQHSLSAVALNDRREPGLPLRSTDFCRLLDSWASVGHAEQFFLQLPSRVRLSEAVLSSYLSALCRSGSLDGVDRLRRHLSANRVRLSLDNYTSLMELFARLRPEHCRQVFSEMQEAGFRPDMNSCR